MHELSIAQEILDIIEKERIDRGFKKVAAVRLRAGALSGVDPQALQFSFEAIRGGTCAAGAQLEIEAQTLQLHCRQCGADSTGERGPVGCVHCGSTNVVFDATADIDIISLEID